MILGLNMDHGATLEIESRGHKSMDRVKVSDDGNAVGLTSNPRSRAVCVLVIVCIV